ncbi:MAG: zinc-ribbon domain-containing protein [Deltaproteobacteria bacterium]|nr:zinc-ribbon domain-containing protein [Deltaproteobacteria bacterium]
MRICNKCSAKIADEAKFCSECGDPVTEEDRLAPEVMGSGPATFEFKFGYSTSANYKKAVKLCTPNPSYRQEGEGRDVQHSISLEVTELELIWKLRRLVRSWKSASILVNGRPSSGNELASPALGCYSRYRKVPDKQQYCFGDSDLNANIWGCRQLGMRVFAWSRWRDDWLEMGHFDEKNAWHFDKERIRQELQRKIQESELCPILNVGRILETLDRLPASINPREDPRWEYKTATLPGDLGPQEVAVGIKPRLRQSGSVDLSVFFPLHNED